ncbi:hypothetical protein UCRPC4_g03479 [Phaeomoniella chlamydospora]|uniref:Uncharacterized protein n=1 Tax=Phaeomoniella chlamydospora TaxID=158046 RepID=A0A0G2EFQ7_PHACM|nr:hypothetical protein UCRPC4_g03479 [Phaeomoniella chlamydospora]
MSDLDPQGPSQPGANASYNQASNPASKEPAEEAASTQRHSDNVIDRRSEHDVPSTHGEEAKPSSLARGSEGPLTEKSIPSSDAQNYSTGDSNLEGEQMRAPGEGDVAFAVEGTHGGAKSEPSFTEDLEQKKEAHRQALEESGQSMEEREREDWTGKKNSVNIEEALGGRGNGVVLTGDTSNLGGGREGLGEA